MHGYQNDIRRIENSQKVETIYLKTDLQLAIRKGIDFLLHQNKREYPEAVHYLILPCLTHDDVEYRTCPTVFFQRMLILDALLDCAEFNERISKQLVEKEVIKIIQAKHRLAKGGWSYIPELPELPPDADDLGLVVQLLARTGGKDLASICDDDLKLLFNYCGNSDGSFNTWIFEPTDTSQFAKRMRNYIEIIGGKGASPDVVSNLLWGLILYDNDRFKVQLENGASYLESCQTDEGFWESKWYWGQYYATYRALSVLQAVAPESQAVKRARDFITKFQNTDGGWGDVSSDPLNTAFALLALLCEQNIHSNQQLLKGISYLIQKQLSEGSWERIPFIKMETVDGILTYESKCTTTAFCLQVLARCSLLDGVPKEFTVAFDNLPYKAQLGNNLTVFSNQNGHWILAKNSRVLFQQFIDLMEQSSSRCFEELPRLHIIELTGKCNQACAYCSVSALYSDTSAKVDINEHAFEKIVDFIVNNSDKDFCVEFQGGESLLNFPTLSRFVDAISNRASKIGKEASFRLVSNLTLLSSEIADYLAEKEIDVSTSLDGTEYLHNKYRKLPGSADCYAKVVDGIKQLRQRGVNVGVLSVITRDALEVPEQIVDNFVELGINSFVLNPVASVGRAEGNWDKLGLIEPKEYSYFWKRLVKHCFTYHRRGIFVLDSTTHLLLQKIILAQDPNYVDLKSPCGAIHGQIAYDLHGNIYPCDAARFNEKVVLGNVLDETFNDICNNPTSLSIKDASVINTSRCGFCAYRPWCGRCPVENKFQLGRYDAPSHETYYCHIWKGIFDRFFELVEEDFEQIQFAARGITNSGDKEES